MRNLQIIIFCLLIKLLTAECSGQVYIPPQLRCSNYSPYGKGSCVHASTISALNYLSAPILARYTRNHYSGGDYHYDLNLRLRKWGVVTRATFSSSKKILDYAHSNSLPAVISYHSNHSCLFLGWYVDKRTIPATITHAYVLNPNHPHQIETPTYQAFFRNWSWNGGEAVVIVPSTQIRRKR